MTRIMDDKAKQIEYLLRSMECVLESDERTMKYQTSEYGWIFDKIHEWRKILYELFKTESVIEQKEDASDCHITLWYDPNTKMVYGVLPGNIKLPAYNPDGSRMLYKGE